MNFLFLTAFFPDDFDDEFSFLRSSENICAGERGGCTVRTRLLRPSSDKNAARDDHTIYFYLALALAVVTQR